MANEDGNSPRERDSVKRKKYASKKPVYFFLDDVLHQRLHINKGADLVTCWNYVEHKRCVHSWSETRKKMKRAMKTAEVSKMINRSDVSIKKAIHRGDIRAPFKIYALNESKTPGRYMWCEKDVLDSHDFFSVQHVGFPRADGLINARPIPSKHELRAMINHDMTTYVKTSDGRFVPTFKEIDW